MERSRIYSFIAITGFYTTSFLGIMMFGKSTEDSSPIDVSRITPLPTYSTPIPRLTPTPYPTGVVLIPKEMQVNRIMTPEIATTRTGVIFLPHEAATPAPRLIRINSD